MPRNAYCFFSARTQADLYALQEMEWIRENWNSDYHFEFIPCLLREAKESDWRGVRGRGLDHFCSDHLQSGRMDVSRCADRRA